LNVAIPQFAQSRSDIQAVTASEFRSMLYTLVAGVDQTSLFPALQNTWTGKRIPETDLNAMHTLLDKNHDGFVSVKELVWDGNQNGVMDLIEMLDSWRRMVISGQSDWSSTVMLYK
jgi:Ca2+-binding EF-hand superfamily protein